MDNQPVGKMPNIKTYKYWGCEEEPPANLKTKKQLSELGLAPIEPRGIIYCSKYDIYLYDINDPTSVRPKRKASDKQLANLAVGRRNQQYKAWFNSWGFTFQDRNLSIEWARSVLADKSNFGILDTETTGLCDAQIVQIGIIDLDGNVLIDRLCKPTIPIEAGAIAVHGITEEIVSDAASFVEIRSAVVDAIAGKTVLMYNADFDLAVLENTCAAWQCEPISIDSDCLMLWYAEYCGDWDRKRRSYRWQKLNGNHNAIGDCIAALQVVEEMAAGNLVDLEDAFQSSPQTQTLAGCDDY